MTTYTPVVATSRAIAGNVREVIRDISDIRYLVLEFPPSHANNFA
ncbi:hypothetical protein [Rhodococcus sp. USK13]|nr:hypothetical protein [Rhodococcus sp. USK13]